MLHIDRYNANHNFDYIILDRYIRYMEAKRSVDTLLSLIYPTDWPVFPVISQPYSFRFTHSISGRLKKYGPISTVFGHETAHHEGTIYANFYSDNLFGA